MKGKSLILNILYVFLGLIVLFLVYSHYEYRHIKIRTIEIKSKDIPEEFNGKRVLFVADFQYDTMARYNKRQQKKAIEMINAQKKDMILLGGDYATWENNIPKFYEDAKDIKIPELGVYAIYGNHEYPGEEETAENMKKLGFNLLVNENRKITINNENIYIAGVTDLWHGKPDAKKALEGLKREDFVLFLTHNPEYFEEMTEDEKQKADITLAGHTHGGQVTFFGKIIMSAIKDKKKYGYGMKEYNGHKIYITSGLGGAFLEMFIRFFAQPEIVIFELKRI